MYRCRRNLTMFRRHWSLITRSLLEICFEKFADLIMFAFLIYWTQYKIFNLRHKSFCFCFTKFFPYFHRLRNVKTNRFCCLCNWDAHNLMLIYFTTVSHALGISIIFLVDLKRLIKSQMSWWTMKISSHWSCKHVLGVPRFQYEHFVFSLSWIVKHFSKPRVLRSLYENFQQVCKQTLRLKLRSQQILLMSSFMCHNKLFFLMSSTEFMKKQQRTNICSTSKFFDLTLRARECELV